MSKYKPLSQCSVSKDDVRMDHEDTSLEHVIKTEEVDLEPDYIECDTDEPEIRVMDEQTDHCDIKVEVEDDKLIEFNVPLYHNIMDIESSKQDVNFQTIVGTRDEIFQHENDTLQDCQVIEIKVEIEPDDETSIDELNKHTDTDTDAHQAQTSYMILNNKTKINKSKSPHTGDNDKPFACNICEFKSARNDYLKRHIRRIHTDEKPFSCSVCNYKFPQSGELVRHMRVHTGEKPYACDICDRTFSHKNSLEQHKLVHTGEKPFSCDICDYKCTNKGRLVLHRRIHTGEKPSSGGKIFPCDLCDRTFLHKISLEYHKATHTGINPFKCDYCDYKCSRKDVLKKHVSRVHDGEKPFSCAICKYTCAQRGDLRRHMRVHTGEKPFLCKICDYKSAQSSGLVKHMKVHSDGPLSCDICNYKCTEKRKLKQHMIVHSGKKTYPCSICDHIYRNTCNLNRHMKLKHKRSEDTVAVKTQKN